MNKLTKVLSVFVLAGAIGTGVAGVAGCAPKPNEGGHTHDYQYTQISGNAEKHNVHCKNEGHEGGDTQEDHSWKDGKCEKCDYLKPAENTDLVISADVTGLMIEGVNTKTITLSEAEKSYTIDKSAIKVYFATGNNADVKGDEVPADNLVLELKDGDGKEVSSWENITKDDTYKINASVKNATMAEGAIATLADLKSTVIVTVSNPVKENSLAVKTGTLTQGASVQNRMSADWTYTVTLANGDVIDYTGAVTVTVDTTTEGEKTATLVSGDYTGTVKVTITASTLRTETYAANLSGKAIGSLADQAPTAEAVTILEHNNTKLEARGLKVEANGTSAARECDGKYFANRAPFEGATFTAAGALQANQRYFILTTEGAAKLTIYWSRNSNKDERGVAVFNSTVTNGDISALTPGATTVAKDMLMGDGTAATQGVQKLEVNIPAAGTYWITTANNQNVYFYYIELTTEFEDAGENVELEDGAATLAQIKVSHPDVDGEKYVQQFVVGDKFTVDEGYSVTGTFTAVNTAKKSEQTLTEVTYWIGNQQLTPDTTILTEELLTKLGETTITVKYGDSTVTGTYTIFVDSSIQGVTGITASIKDTVNLEISGESDKLTLNKTDIEIAIVGTNEDASVTSYTFKYRLATAEEGSETEITESVELGAGEYVLYVVATVTDSTANKSAEFETTGKFIITVAGNIKDIKYTVSADDVTAVGTSNSTVENKLLDDANGKIVVGTNCKGGTNKITVDEVEYSNRIQLGGAYKAADGSKNAIVLTVKEPCTIRVIYNTSSNGNARTLSLFNSEGEKVVAGEAVDGAKMVEYTISEAGTYYLGSESGAINIWYVEIDYTSNNA